MEVRNQTPAKEPTAYMFYRAKTHRYRISSILVLLTALLLLIGCTQSDPSKAVQTTDAASAPVPQTAEPAEPDTPPSVESYPFAIMLDDGTEITVSLPRDPEYYAELHLCALSGEETPVRVILQNLAGGTGVLLEEARVFSGDDGTEYPVVSPDEVLGRYVTFTDSEDAWHMTVEGAEYLIPKAQFSDYPTEALFPLPNPSMWQNFYVENGQLFCRVSFLCAGDGTGFAAETLRIRYDLIDGTVTASEITFERPEIAESEETA